MDQRENLRILARAYEDNKISRDLLACAKAMIQKTMEIPEIRLRNLFEQYITFRAIQDARRKLLLQQN
ncbi:hypothetical protein DPMN_186799 [Dreissena polymorpha]|uniref:FAM186A/B C-terminal domain-containing protein n=1 Tax=Dreissena polymorpha TaxID=45954 RepID=A0A9D4I9W4_DREPO|nr:hypothetical protein DPMN_186779 [Dreissena polymorpha]KAH3752187.1 hypothetical protein DPMN_186799 [Dreissena polymorpha]